MYVLQTPILTQECGATKGMVGVGSGGGRAGGTDLAIGSARSMCRGRRTLGQSSAEILSRGAPALCGSLHNAHLTVACDPPSAECDHHFQ